MIDAGIAELSGLSVFAKNAAGDVFHNYSSYARGTEELLTTYMLLDMTPKGETKPVRTTNSWIGCGGMMSTKKKRFGAVMPRSLDLPMGSAVHRGLRTAVYRTIDD